MTLTRKQLEQAILQTMADIEKVKQQIAKAVEPKEKQRLLREKKELQYLQLWHLSQFENMDD